MSKESLSYSESLKSFSLNLLASEIGFVGINPVSKHNIYEGYVDLFNGIRKKFKTKDFSDEHCNFYCPSRQTVIEFQVDYPKDMGFVVALAKRINTNNDMCGGVCNVAVDLNVKLIYDTISEILNTDDSYFEVLVELWKTLSQPAHTLEQIAAMKETKLKRLNHPFNLNKRRIEMLLATK